MSRFMSVTQTMSTSCSNVSNVSSWATFLGSASIVTRGLRLSTRVFAASAFWLGGSAVHNTDIGRQEQGRMNVTDESRGRQE